MNKHNGFTYIELIVSAVILSLAVAGVFAAFISSTKFTGSLKHDIMATVSAQGYLEQACAACTFTTVDSVAQPNTASWPLNNEVTILPFPNTRSTVTSGVNLGCTNPAYNFKRVDIAVNWDEREI